MLTQEQMQISTLGERKHPSPLAKPNSTGFCRTNFTPDSSRVLVEIEFDANDRPDDSPVDDLAFERAGARETLYFDPPRTRAAIVTCGGLCPGLNNVIRTLYLELALNYGIKEVLGIRYGYKGLNPAAECQPVELTDDLVEEIHHHGGTVLGTSRGGQDPAVTVDFLVERKIDILYCVGGDGTMHGAHNIAAEVARRKLPIAIVGVPKTIDNDIKFCYRTFGFFTAIAEADKVIDGAHTEAKSVERGVGLVKLMGREAGFIAAAATIASGQVDFTLIPESPFELQGDHGLLSKLERRLAAHDHAVIVVAEGAGQNLLPEFEESCDASGNRKLGDIGSFLRQQIKEHFSEIGQPASVKYLDPSYAIRSCPANTADARLCEQLARNAAHAGMAGKTDMFPSVWHNRVVEVPLVISAGKKRRLNLESDLWASVLAMTRQERW